VVIYGQDANDAIPVGGLGLLTDSTDSTLRLEEGLIVFWRQPVLSFKVLSPSLPGQLFGVIPCPLPRYLTRAVPVTFAPSLAGRRRAFPVSSYLCVFRLCPSALIAATPMIAVGIDGSMRSRLARL